MQTCKKQAARLFIIGIMWLSLSATTFAWEPNTNDRNAAIKSGDFKQYSGNLTAWLKQKVPTNPAQITNAKMRALLRDSAFMKALIEHHFINKAWGMGDWAKADPKNAAFVAWVMSSPRLMDEVMLARTPSSMFPRYDNSWSIEAWVLNIWKQIYYAHPESRKGLYLRLAVATMLRPPGTGNRGAGMAKVQSTPLARFEHYMKAHKAKELFPSFDTLSIWELTHVVSSGASNKDLTWGRECVNTWGPGFKAHEGVVGLTSQMAYRGSQIPYSNMACLLGGGGKCGPRSSFGVFICQAFGIPAIGVGQPSHAAIAFRDRNGNWQVVFGRGWNVSKVFDRGKMSGAEFLERVQERKSNRFGTLEHLRWLSITLPKNLCDAVMAAADRISKSDKDIINTIPFDAKPDEKSVLRSLECPEDVGDNYGVRVRGFFYPPKSGEYVFGIASDDESDLFLSTDDNPDNKKFIAHVRGWTEVGNFKKFPSQQSKPIRLVGGKKYYIEAVHKEHGGGDHMCVGWRSTSEELRVISGTYLSPYPSGKKGTIVRELWKDSTAPAVAAAKPMTKPEAPIKVAPGTIHVEAETFFDWGHLENWGGPGVAISDCYTGGKQVNFGAGNQAAWVGYKIDVPKTGIYELRARGAAINWHQRLYVRTFGAMYPVKAAKASDVYREQYAALGAQMATDSNLSTRWAMNLGKEKGWIELDLGQPRKISKLIIDEHSFNRVSNYRVEYKVGKDWTKLFEGGDIGVLLKEFPAVTAQYVRLVTLDSRSPSGGPTIWEFSVGDVFDGSGWIGFPWSTGLWATTDPIDIRLVKGARTIWLCAPNQRGIALRWFELKLKGS